MIATTKPLSEITQEAIDILIREIGIVNTVRFLNQFTGGFGNYSEDREVLYGEFTMEQILNSIREDHAEEANS